MSDDVTFEVVPFGTYRARRGAGAPELVRSLAEHLQIPHLGLGSFRVGEQALRNSDSVGSWPLVHGTTLTFSASAQPDAAALALTEHALRVDTSELMPVLEIPGIRSGSGAMNTSRVRASIRVAYLVTRTPAPARFAWLRWFFAVAHAIESVWLTIRLYVGGIRFRDGITLHRVGHGVRARSVTHVGAANKKVTQAPERYELRAPLNPTAVDRALAALATPLPEESSSSKAGLLLSALVPFAMSVVLAVVMRQPYFLLFALTGPVLALVHLVSRRRVVPGQVEMRALPAWVQRGLQGQCVEALTTLLQLAVQGTLTLTQWPLLGSSPASGRRLAAPRLGDHAFAVDLSIRLLSLASGGSSSGNASTRGSTRIGLVQAVDTTPDMRDGVVPTVHVVTSRPQVIHDSWLRWLAPLLRIHESSQTVPDDPHHVMLHVDSIPGLRGVSGISGNGMLDRWARALTAYLTVGSATAGLPRVAPFTQMWNPRAGAPPWRTEVEDSLVIPVGVGAQGAFTIDLVADGPHMLVAGTTGAGKSEFLQSLIVATATTYSAHDVNFMLIDYKGGAGLGRCHRLPHSCGMVTDLDPGETSRALAGLRAELKRRELRFHEVGVSDITEYNRTVSRVERIARIVVVVDEFRALSEEHPEFLTKLIRLAAQGRSLGIHLILATQRPAGAVGPELRANINLRISLRVADEQDSLDVLGVKDGAHLPVEAPGRFLARTGGAPPTRAQAFYLDAAPTLPQHLVTLPGARGADTPTADVPDVIGALVSAHDARFGIRATRFWSPGLPSVFTGQQDTDVLHEAQVVALGAPEDSTGHQALTWDPTLGHLAVVGPSLRGRTSSLLSLAQCSPTGTRIHWVGPVTDHTQVKRALTSASAHLVNLVDSSNPYMVHALIRAIASTSATPGPAESRTLLVIDDLDALRTTLETYDRGSGLELVENLLKIGPAQGIACAVSTARPITGGLQSLFGQRLILASGNVDTDATNAVPRELLPLPSHRGRAAWSTPNGTVVCQIRAPHLGTQAAQWDSENYDEQRIWSLADMPVSPTPGVLTGPRPSAFDPTTVNAMIVAGPRRSGRSATLDVLATNWAGTPYGSRRLAGRNHHIGDDLEDLIGVLEAGTPHIALIQIDDLDVVEATHGHLVQRLLDLALGAGITVHGSCTTAGLHQSYRGALAALREYENVLLLCPDPAKDRELLGTSIVLAVDPRPHPGKAVLMLAGHIAAARVDCGEGES